MTSSLRNDISGLSFRENEMGWIAVRLHWSADPNKTDEWYQEACRFFGDPNKVASELDINWFITTGTRVYPEFTETLHARPLALRTRKVIYRAWDFGWHAPVCLFGQIDEKDRLCVLHEVVGREETTRDFAQKVIERTAEWFPHHGPGVLDFCDPAGQQAQPAAEKGEMRDVEVLQNFGIHPSWENGWSRKDGRALIHQLLRVRSDGTPGLYLDASGCPILLQAFLGKFSFPESRDGRVKDEPDEGLHPWADTQAALRYMVTGLYTALGLRRNQAIPKFDKPKVAYMGYGTPIGRR